MDYIILIIIGLAMVSIATSLLFRQNDIKKRGLKTEGIVHDLQSTQTTSFNFRYPVIRFITLTQDWITETANIGMLPSIYKTGQKVTVIYKEESPKEFIIESKGNSLIITIILIVGCALLFFGTYKLIGVEL